MEIGQQNEEESTMDSRLLRIFTEVENFLMQNNKKDDSLGR